MKFATVRAFAVALPGASEAPHHHLAGADAATVKQLAREAWECKAPRAPKGKGA